MKQKHLLSKLLLLVAVFVMGAGTAWAADETITFSSLYDSNTTLDDAWINGTNFSIKFNRRSGGTATQYYTNGSAVRWYGGGKMTVYSATKTIEKIEITFTQTANTITTDVGEYEDGTWTGSASTVIFSQSGTAGHCRISSIAVTYAGGSSATTYTVTYDGNGNTSGDVPTDDTEYDADNNTVTVLGNTGNLAKDHYTFAGWNTASDGTGTGYDADDTFTISANITLYAQWLANTNTVTLPAADEYGSYTMNATSPVAYNTEVTLTYTPAQGYENYQATWSVNGVEISGNKFTMPDEAVIITVSVKKVQAMTIDFESEDNTYSNWTFTNMTTKQTNSGVDAHGGSYFGTTGGKATASVQTASKVSPASLTCYVSKQTTNTSASTWYIQVSTDGTTWTDVESTDAKDMSKGEWKEFTADLSSYSDADVYVRVYYSGTTAVRCIDDLSLVLQDSDKPSISADNVEIAYDATEDGIIYTINNYVAGTMTVSTEANWISGLNTDDDEFDSANNEGIKYFSATVNTGAARSATVTLTFTYGDNETVTKDVTITQTGDPNRPGTQNNPYTVAQALAAIDANEDVTDVYVTGIVTRNTYFSESNGTITYFISDDGTENNELEAYSGKDINGAKFTSEDDIQKGDVVVVRGNLVLYHNNSTGEDVYEFSSGNQLVSLDRKEVKYYLAGSWGENDYGWGEGMEQLTKSGNTYTISKNLANGTLFKIVKVDETVTPTTTTWYGGPADGEWFGVNSNVNENLSMSNTGKNFKIEGTCDDSFTFTVNVENPDALTLTVTGWHVPVVKYYLAGNWSNNWGDGKVELTENADGTYSTSKLVGKGSRFKFVKTVDGIETWYGANQTGDDYGIHSAWCTDIELSDNGDASAFVVQMAFDKELAFILNADDLKFSVTGWPISIEGNLFVKVTSTDDFTDGAYLIVNETAGVAFDGSLEALDAANNVINVKIVNNTIVANSKTKQSLFTIVNNGKITSANGNYIGVSGQSNGLKLDESATYYTNSVTIENGNADITINTGGTNYMHLKYNNGSNDNRFRYYKNGQQDIQLYKLITATEIPVAVSAAGYATYCSENALDFSNVEGLKAYTAEISTDKKVSFTEITEAIPAGQGVLLKGNEGTYNIPVATSANAPAKNDFIGVTAETPNVPAGIFVLMNPTGGMGVGFYKTTTAFTVGANTAYLPALAGGAEGAARTFIGLDDTVTAIEGVAAEKMLNGEVYNLQGQRVESSMVNGQSSMLKKGLYIMNGKKVLVK